ncbi:MAG: NifB/NifX family molybdenum-iron cluster-binding protein [SAR324 cluster bacterium]|nr:NifB/NifX family molybdenum-iron cluster-binding protein [SAR324 cluster bacterium]
MKVQRELTAPEAQKGDLRVAFATSNGVSINDHFGKGMEFLLFDINATGYTKSGKITFEAEEGDDPEHTDRNFVKVDALDKCHIVYSRKIGGPVAAKLTQRKIQPLIVKKEDNIEKLLNDFKGMLEQPPLWIAKLIGTEDPNRFAAFDEDDED